MAAGQKMDVTKQLDVLAGEIDVVIDKGCFDAILVCFTAWFTRAMCV